MCGIIMWKNFCGLIGPQAKPSLKKEKTVVLFFFESGISTMSKMSSQNKCIKSGKCDGWMDHHNVCGGLAYYW
jgi:hypothetical protein